MQLEDLPLVREWLGDPVAAQWYLAGSSLDEQLEDLRQSILGEEPTEVLVAAEDGQSIGWCQWYLCRDYPEHAAAVEAEPQDVGIDYAIGEAARRGAGLGSALIAALVSHIRQRYPQASVISDPQASNVGSRKVLERNGFQLVAERPLPSEPTPDPMAIYRLAPDVGH
ncbi:MAG: GNAT family N-acetyltransferase [Streptosporangiaceae bacterium]